MIAILEWTQSNVQQNIEQSQTPTMGGTINKKSTTTEPPPQNGQQPKPSKSVEKCESCGRLNICKRTIMEAALL